MRISKLKNDDCKPELLQKVYNWFNQIENYLLPAQCLLCEQTGWQDLDLCYGCYQHLLKNELCCVRCARPVNQTNLCGSCLKQAPQFDTVFAPFMYQEGLRYLITQFKYHNDYKNARTLGLLLAKQLQLIEPPDCIIPVPLHKTRYRQRGFNQAIEIAKILSHELNIPLNLSSCIRQRNTSQQTRLTSKQRRTNVKNAFKVLNSLEHQHIAIVDDVLTTGSTANELAKMLKKAGASRVDVWVCARA